MPKFKLILSPGFVSEYGYWARTNPKTVAKIDALIESISNDPFRGIGKPEPLKHVAFKNSWSRRITGEHRLVYQVDKGAVIFLSCRYHY